MEWYNYIACFFAGIFMANSLPHFIHGISGDKFPTPFAKPPGKGLSSAPVNMVWGLFNIIIGALLFSTGKVCHNGPANWIIFFAGVTAISLMLSFHFQKKDKE